MLWRGGRRSENVEDRRGMGMPAGMRFPGGRGGGGFGRVGLAGGVVLLLVSLLFGIDPGVILDQTTPAPGNQSAYPPGPTRSASDDELREFVSVVLADTEDTWNAVFAEAGRDYREPTLVLFSGAVDSACGFAQAAVGPFYCPLDQKVYIDLSFYRDLRNRFQAPGDFAQAYVIAHEIGHHVQNLLGITGEVRSTQRAVSRSESNALSVRVELQADCLSGIWANHAQRERRVLEPGDIDEALNAASAIGDDRLQAQSRGYVTPDSFTHGTSEQRANWFYRGFQAGNMQACDTFSGETAAGG
jgi:predicted metalloprotease